MLDCVSSNIKLDPIPNTSVIKQITAILRQVLQLSCELYLSIYFFIL